MLQTVHGTVAEQAVEVLRVAGLVAGEELAGPVLGEGVGALLGLFGVDIVHVSPPR